MVGRGVKGDLLPACEGHRADSVAACEALYALRPLPGSVNRAGPHAAETQALTERVVTRDAAEQRGERVDWSQPVEGWKLL